MALVDYADGLARLSDERAWGYFEEAIDSHPEDNEAAINLYAQHLLTRGYAQEAFELLDTLLTSEQRVQSIVQAFLRKQAMEAVGLDVTSADEEIAMAKQRMSEQPTMGYSLAEESNPGVAIVESALTDGRVSTVFAVRSDNAVLKRQLYNDSSMSSLLAFAGPPAVGVLKVATLQWPNSNRGGLVAIGTDNKVYYRYFNGTSWGSWQTLGGVAFDVTAVVHANGVADIFVVGLYINPSNNLYVAHSSTGTSFGAFQAWGCCGTEITAARQGNTTIVAVKGDGTTTQSCLRNQACTRSSTNSGLNWTGWTSLGGSVNDLALLAYPTPPPGTTIKMGLNAIGADNCTLYASNWNGSSWSPLGPITSCFKRVSAFNTSVLNPSADQGAYLLLLHRDTNVLYTLRYTGTAWGGLVQQGAQPWVATAGANFDDSGDPPYEHNIFNDDCRLQYQTCYPDPNVPGACFRAQTLNLAEILYNEARGETRGAQALVGWTVCDRAYQKLKNNCDSYPGAEGGALTGTCRATVPCNDPFFCEESKKYCCAMHGGTTTLGAGQYQFNDEHVPFSTLYNEGFAYRAVHILNGFIPDVSTGFIPSGMSGCTTNCTDPWCQYGVNTWQASSAGPEEYRSYDYRSEVSGLPQYAPTCKTWKGNICSGGAPGDNYFWNRTP